MKRLFEVKDWYTKKVKEKHLELGDTVKIVGYLYRVIQEPADEFIYCEFIDPDYIGVHRFLDTQVEEIVEIDYEEYTIKPNWMT
jgi:hypothetical protein